MVIYPNQGILDIQLLLLLLLFFFGNCAYIYRCLLGSVWIGLILLKLKTYCWNHCNKIIFKCVNSTVGLIFNEKIDKKWNLWVHEQCTDALFTGKSQHLRLLFMHCSLNSSRIPPKMREKKKKKRKEWKCNFSKCRRNKCYPN